MAEYHFRRAVGIHPRSSVLRCYLGMAIARAASAAAAAASAAAAARSDLSPPPSSSPPELDSRSRDAVRELSRAVELDGRNPLARFELSAALSDLGEVEAALSALLPLLSGGGGSGRNASSFASSFASSSSSSSSSVAAREPAVWYQCARLYRRLGKLREARDHLNAALDLRPPPADTAKIKAVLEKCCAALVSQERQQQQKRRGIGTLEMVAAFNNFDWDVSFCDEL